MLATAAAKLLLLLLAPFLVRHRSRLKSAASPSPALEARCPPRPPLLVPPRLSSILLPGNAWCVRLNCNDASRTLAVTGGVDSVARMFELEYAQELSSVACPDAILALDLSHDGKHVLIGCVDGTLLFWTAFKMCVVWARLDSSILSVALGLRDLSVAGTEGGRVHLYLKGHAWKVLSGHAGCVSCVCVAGPGNLIFSCSYDGAVRMWDCFSQPHDQHPQAPTSAHPFGVALPQQQALASAHSAPRELNCVCASPDGKYVMAGGDDGTLMVWTRAALRLAHVLFHGEEEMVFCVSADASSRAFTGSTTGRVFIWCLARGAALGVFEAGTSRVASVSASRSGRRLVVAVFSSIALFDTLCGGDRDAVLALALAGHARLGAHSPLRALPLDVTKLVAKCL
jgi:WD40 repeat protein